MSDAVSSYDAKAGILAARYETVRADAVHGTLLQFIPHGSDLIALDVGAGSGRDAAWLTSLGYDVVAVEPAASMRVEGQRRHPDGRIRWIEDRLPDLTGVNRLGLAFDLIMLSAVWMHVPPPVRARAFRKLVTLLKPGGTMLMSLREGRATRTGRCGLHRLERSNRSREPMGSRSCARSTPLINSAVPTCTGPACACACQTMVPARFRCYGV
jgi:SAM-dependent methyltransferase